MTACSHTQIGYFMTHFLLHFYSQTYQIANAIVKRQYNWAVFSSFFSVNTKDFSVNTVKVDLLNQISGGDSTEKEVNFNPETIISYDSRWEWDAHHLLEKKTLFDYKLLYYSCLQLSCFYF